jgi:hypothetical protein
MAYLGSAEVAGLVPGGAAVSEDGDGLRVYALAAGVASVHLMQRHGAPLAGAVTQRQGTSFEEVGRVDVLDAGTYRLRWLDGLLVTSALRRGHDLQVSDVTRAGPAVPGDLAVPEFSGCLRRVGEHLLAAVGDARLVGGRLEVHTFDVTDPAAPRPVDVLRFRTLVKARGASSLHSLYRARSRTLVLPVTFRAAKRWSAGLLAVRIGSDGTLVEAGRWSSDTRSARTTGTVNAAFLPLAGGRIVVLTEGRTTILDADDLAVRGSARLALVRRGPR